ncbi:TatD family hydrolase [Candidatus Woesebacteria bacterium]|nr:TatD family hydrolase [Candidatus Woesebacteria bacterium]
MTKIIDTHCHYNMEPILGDATEHWQKSKKMGIEKSVVVGTNLIDSKLAIKISNENDGLFASIGLHPENFDEAIKNILHGDKFSQLEIDNYLNKSLTDFFEFANKILSTKTLNEKNKLVAIGEIGLDYYRLKTKGLKRNLVVELQKKAFTQLLEFAFKNNLVAIIHVRDLAERTEENAYYDVLAILKSVISTLDKKITPKFVLHCASGPVDYIKEAISLGGYVGFAGNITYHNSQNLREILQIVPKDKILIETDAPFLIPESQKNTDNNDQYCEPYMIKYTAEYLESEMGVNLDIIKRNSEKLFSI